MNITRLKFLLFLSLLGGLAGCAGTQTFGTAARAGDTVTLAVGWLTNLKRQNLSVTVTPSSGPAITNVPVRAVINLYPDPSSGLIVGTQTKQNLGNNDQFTGDRINWFLTNRDAEWMQSTILLDLPPPASLPPGNATITVVDSAGATIRPIAITVLPGTGSSDLFHVVHPFYPGIYDFDLLSGYPGAFKSLEHAARYLVKIASYKVNGVDVIPHALQVEFTRTAGVGKPWVVNPRGDIKSVFWSDDGTNLKVMVMPTNGKTLLPDEGGLINQKFYIAGGITGLSQPTVKAYDINGNLMTGISATVEYQP